MWMLARGMMCLVVVVGGFAATRCDAGDVVSSRLADYLKQGQLADAEYYLKTQIAADPQPDQARFALGVVQVLSAIEHLGQEQYQYGAMSGQVSNLPVFRLPLPINPNPEEVTYTQVRQVFLHLQTRMLAAEATLAKVDLKQEVKLPIDLMSIRLDLNGDGKSDDKESFSVLFGVANRPRPGTQAADLKVTFDNGDVPWLRGYCHFLCAVCDIMLAYDHQRMFDVSGHLIYPKAVPPRAGLEPLDIGQRGDGDWTRQLMDAIAAVHLADFPLKEPKRMSSARGHLLEMIRTSRESWVLIEAETDNDQEWLPNPKQTGVLRIPVTREFIDGWHGVLAEMEDLLEGRKLVPFWRDYSGQFFFNGTLQDVPATGRGVNLKRFFEEPSRFDLVLLLQGTAALPYVEKGDLSRPETWNNLTRVFQGQFFGFAIWFN
jgi:hypothetical protein